jgi:hypothetical protein
MNKIKAKILKEKIKDDERVIMVLWRIRKLDFLPKFWLLDVQAVLSSFYYKRLFLR